MKSIIIVCAALTVVCALRSADYYWRDYDGTIPEDAFKATGEVDTCGVDQDVFYIVQTYVHSVGVLVGQLAPGGDVVYTTGGLEHKREVYARKRNIKILCTRSPRNFQWFPTSFYWIQKHKDLNFVIGGTQSAKEGHLWIGRIKYNGRWKIGKVDGYWDGNIDLYFADNGREISRVNDASLSSLWWEVLIYNETRCGL